MVPLFYRRTNDIQRAVDLCGETYQCQYDYAMSLNRDLAHFTKNYYDTYTKIRDLNMNERGACRNEFVKKNCVCTRSNFPEIV